MRRKHESAIGFSLLADARIGMVKRNEEHPAEDSMKRRIAVNGRKDVHKLILRACALDPKLAGVLFVVFARLTRGTETADDLALARKLFERASQEDVRANHLEDDIRSCLDSVLDAIEIWFSARIRHNEEDARGLLARRAGVDAV